MTVEEFKRWFDKGNMHIICRTLQERESAAKFLVSLGYRDFYLHDGKLHGIDDKYMCPFLSGGSKHLSYRTLSSTISNHSKQSIEYYELPIFADPVDLQVNERAEDMMSFLYAEVSVK